MQDEMWCVFRDTGEPMSYVLLSAVRSGENARKEEKKHENDGREPQTGGGDKPPRR